MLSECNDKKNSIKRTRLLVPEDEKSFNHFLVIFGFCLTLSFLYLLFTTKSSPLYPMNDWVDVNIAFTMGKGMMNGRVLYRDLFDHKGPLYYFVYGLAYLISNMSFVGVFMFEVISFSIFLFFCYKLARFFLDQNYALITLPIMAGAVLNSYSFAYGGSAEEFSLPLIAISVYYLIRYYIEVYPDPMPHRWVFINGIIAGCIVWIKYSLIGFWVGWVATLFIALLINKQKTPAFKVLVVYVLGVITATLPWVFYFGINHSIYEWINVYFFVNLLSYSDTTSLFDRFSTMSVFLIFHFAKNPLSVGLMGIGLYVFAKNEKFITHRVNRLGLLCCVLLLFFSVYGGGKGYLHYFFIFSIFVLFGIIVLLRLHADEFGGINSKKLLVTIIMVSMMAVFSYTYQANQNQSMLLVDKDELVQYRFASIITQIDDPSLLNYGWLDGGFYTASGIIPNIRFFHKPNFNYEMFPLIIDEQQQYIQEQIVDFVVIGMPNSYFEGYVDVPYLNENYVLIETGIQKSEDVDYIYLLYKDRDLDT